MLMVGKKYFTTITITRHQDVIQVRNVHVFTAQITTMNQKDGDHLKMLNYNLRVDLQARLVNTSILQTITFRRYFNSKLRLAASFIAFKREGCSQIMTSSHPTSNHLDV